MDGEGGEDGESLDSDNNKAMTKRVVQAGAEEQGGRRAGGAGRVARTMPAGPGLSVGKHASFAFNDWLHVDGRKSSRLMVDISHLQRGVRFPYRHTARTLTIEPVLCSRPQDQRDVSRT